MVLKEPVAKKADREITCKFACKSVWPKRPMPVCCPSFTLSLKPFVSPSTKLMPPPAFLLCLGRWKGKGRREGKEEKRGKRRERKEEERKGRNSFPSSHSKNLDITWYLVPTGYWCLHLKDDAIINGESIVIKWNTLLTGLSITNARNIQPSVEKKLLHVHT